MGIHEKPLDLPSILESGGAVELNLASLAGDPTDTVNKSDFDERSFLNLLSNGDFEVGDPPTGWVLGGCSTSREGGAGLHPIGLYSVKIHTAGGNWANIYQDIPTFDRYKGRKVTFGAWCRADSGNVAGQSLYIRDSVGTDSVAVPKDDAWHWKIVTRTVDPEATSLQVQAYVCVGAFDAGDILYVDGAILVEGDSCPAFSPKPDDSIICAHTAAYTISQHEFGHVVHTNYGAGGVVAVTLPATPPAGFVARFAVGAAHELRVTIGAAGKFLCVTGAVTTDDGGGDLYVSADDEGETLELTADGSGNWFATAMSGTWTVVQP